MPDAQNPMPIDIVSAVAAARSGDVQTLGTWVQGGGDPNQYDATGWTALLAASVRGQVGAVELLLSAGANIDQKHRDSGALPIHLAGQSGSVATVRSLLARRPEHVNAVWTELNGHTVLLQAVFYGYLDIAQLAIDSGADMAVTSARGLGAMEMALQYQNQPMVDLLRPHDTTAAAKAAYYQGFLARIAPVIPPAEAAAQKLTDDLVRAIEDGLRRAATDPAAVKATLDAVQSLVTCGADVNRLGGPLSQPPLVVAVTGNNGQPPVDAVADLRLKLAETLLAQGASPILHEVHPMGATTIIRAAVFNHLTILRACAKAITAQQLADALNEIPLVNGLTAMHDTVLRASMAAGDAKAFDGYLEQIRWFVASGARSDIEDFSGKTQRDTADAAPPAARARIYDALGLTPDQRNIQTIKTHIATFARGDIDTIRQQVTEDVVWLPPPSNLVPYNRAWRGRDGVAEYCRLLYANLQFEYFEAPFVLAVEGSRVLVIGRETFIVRPTGHRVHNDWSITFTLRDGLISEFRMFENTEKVTAAFMV